MIGRLLLGFAILLAIAAPVAAAPGANGDRSAAAAQVRSKGYTPDLSTWDSYFGLNVLIGRATGSADGYNQLAFFFVGRRYLGTDTAAPSSQVEEVWRDDRTIALLYVLYRPRDALCCPTAGGAIVRYRWTGKRLVALDPIPPRSGPRHR